MNRKISQEGVLSSRTDSVGGINIEIPWIQIGGSGVDIRGQDIISLLNLYKGNRIRLTIELLPDEDVSRGKK